MAEPTLFPGRPEPLAARMRPRTLDEFLGQEHLLGRGKALDELIRRGEIGSSIFWGPPGSGKTTLARIIAGYSSRQFEPFSAVTEGVARVRAIIAGAEERLRHEGRGTILFCDEIHRFNRGQQDAFLPSVEAGVITLLGATTENPSFELTGALLSRCRVFVLNPLEPEHVRLVVERAIEREAGESRERGAVRFGADAIDALVQYAQGDARRALNGLEATFLHLKDGPSLPEHLSREHVVALLEKRLPLHDKSGESHFNLISALHKSVRGSDVEGTLYWLARMLAGGEDPLYVARRLVRIASEDVGLADPRALSIALAAKDAFHFLGSPEGELALAQAAVYLATAPKSNRLYLAFGRAADAAHEHSAAPVPHHLRNAPTRLMRDLGYGEGYRYGHDDSSGHLPQEYLPDALRGARWYEPVDRGYEKTIQERIQWWDSLKARAGAGGAPTSGDTER